MDNRTPGAPIIPMLASRLYIPEGLSVDAVDVAYGALTTLPGTYRLAHATSPVPLTGTAAPVPEPADTAIYDSNQPYPAAVVNRLSDQRLHGRRIATTQVYPVRYRPASGQLEYAATVTVTVQASPVKTAPADLVAPSAAPDDLKDVLGHIDNGALLRSKAADAGAVPLDTSRHYLLITTNALLSAFTPLLNHRAASAGGSFNTASVTVETIAATQSGSDLATKIRNYIRDSYTNYGTRFVLLGGDADGAIAAQALPIRGCSATVGSYADADIPSDLYYACLDGTWDNDGDGIYGESNDGVGGADIDWLPEVAVGRIPADTTTEVQTAVNKIIAYETSANPIKALLVGEQLDTTPTWGGDRMDYVYAAMNSLPRDTLYDRDDPSHNWSAATLRTMMSSNTYGVVFHLGHSNVTYNMKMGNADLGSITNSKPFLLYSQGCYANSIDGRGTGTSYYTEDSIGEDFLVANANNAYAYIGNSRYGWYNSGTYTQGASNLVHRKFAEAVYQNNTRRVGSANNASKSALNYTDGVYRWLGFEINLMGDPATPISSDCSATELSVAITAPAAQFSARIGNATQITAGLTTACGDPVAGGTVQATFSTGDTAVSLYDDGAHGDGAAADGVYGATWTPRHAGSATLTVTAAKTGFAQVQATAAGTVLPANAYTVSSTPYAWIDDADATVLITTGDDATVTITPGFAFPFYGASVTSLSISTNGHMTLNNSPTSYTNAAIPNTATPNALIACFWDDLVLDAALGSRLSWQTIGASPNAKLVVTWKNVKHFGETVASAPAAFQVILDEHTGSIIMQYANVTFGSATYTGGANATVGIEDATGSDGLQYSYNSASLAAGTAVIFRPYTGASAMNLTSVLQLLLQ